MAELEEAADVRTRIDNATPSRDDLINFLLGKLAQAEKGDGTVIVHLHDVLSSGLELRKYPLAQIKQELEDKGYTIDIIKNKANVVVGAKITIP